LKHLECSRLYMLLIIIIWVMKGFWGRGR